MTVPPSSSTRPRNSPAFVAAVRDALDGLPDELVARPVVVIGGRPRLHRWLRSTWPHLDVVPLGAGGLDLALAGAGPCAVLIDVQNPRRWRARLAATFFHVAVGGRYLMWFEDEASSQCRAAADLVDRVRRGDLTTAPHVPDMGEQTTAERDLRYLAEALQDVEVRGDTLTATAGLAVVLKVHDEDYDAVAASRGAGSRTLATHDSAVLESQARLTLSERTPRNDFRRTFEAPAAWLRTHDDVVCRDRQLAVQTGMVLPASFRRPRVRRLRTTALIDVAADFARMPQPRAETALEGTYYHLDGEIPGHFGHVMTEVASRLWGWSTARRSFPDLRLLLAAPPEGDYGSWFYDFLQAAGVDRGDVTLFRGAARVQRLVTASALYSIGDFVHPAMRADYDRLGARLAAMATTTPDEVPSRVFFTRDSERRGCRNRDEVEALFERHGFVVLRPEKLSLPEQVAIVRGAECIGGFAGSNLLHLGLCGAPKHVVVVSSDTYHVNNEHQLSALLGHRLVVSTSRADVPRRGAAFDGEAYRSTFAVDLAAEGAFLDRELARLP